ncbi:S-adenosyl-L-methionine-dependent methyltransferase [Cladochytrium replicatum]|nr:S-adenosyl-L-methionine-dependent methyltransferase [Cladochytrium replicatum]
MSIRALEFFSGIGGLHYGFERSGATGEVVAAFDINPNANACYRHNFGVEPNQTGIDHLTTEHLDSFKANCWLLSPPCQPYTKSGKMLDDEDPRAAALLHLIRLLPKLSVPPKYIFLENVPNFELSRSKALLVRILRSLGYVFSEWLLSPLQFGVPNERLRYYLTSVRVRDCSDNIVDGIYRSEVGENLARVRTRWPRTDPDPGDIIPIKEVVNESVAKLEGFLDDDVDINAWKVPDTFVRSRTYFGEMVVVRPSDRRCTCFTKSYGHHGVGAGSYIQTKELEMAERPLDNPLVAVETLGLRLFTPNEVARIHGFPLDGKSACPRGSTIHGFSFPPSLSTRQTYRLLGNSLNVKVVGDLLKHELFS